jgi:hypothetical protein
MMRFIVGANSFAHKALNRRMNSPLHQAQLPDLGLSVLSLFRCRSEIIPAFAASHRPAVGLAWEYPGRRERMPENRCDSSSYSQP